MFLYPKKSAALFFADMNLILGLSSATIIVFLSLVKLHSGTFPGKKFEHTVDEHYLYYQGFPKALNKSRNVLTRSLNLVKFLSKAKNFIVTAAKIKSEMV